MKGNLNMKTIVYGPTGYGKSYSVIAPIIRKNENIILISENGCSNELRGMGLSTDVLKVVKLDDLKTLDNLGRLALDISVPHIKSEEYLFGVILPTIESLKITDDSNNTIIISGFIKAMNDVDIVERISEYKANVVVEYTCDKIDLEQGEIEYILRQEDWNKISVFQKYNDIID